MYVLDFFDRVAKRRSFSYFTKMWFHNRRSSIKLLHYRPFSEKLPTLSKYSKETFFLESAFADVRNSGLQGCSVREKGTLSQRFFWNFRNFRMSFPFWALSECICNKMELQYIFFSDNVPKFSVQLFQNTLIKLSVMEFSRVLDYTPWSCFILKNDSTRDNSLKFPLKNLWWIPILIATCNICKNRLIHRRCPSGYCEMYYVQSTELWSSVLVKKTLSLDLSESEKRSLTRAFCWRCSIPLATSRKFFESLFIANLQAFLVNDGAQFDILVPDVRNFLYYEHWTAKQKYFYVLLNIK